MLFCYISFVCLIISSFSEPVSIYINNSATNSFQDGSLDNPYTSFGASALDNITTLLPNVSVSILFAPTSIPYTFSLDLKLSSINESSVLTFMTTSENVSETEYAQLSFVNFSMISDYLKIVFHKLNVTDAQEDPTSVFFMEAKNLEVDIKHFKYQFYVSRTAIVCFNSTVETISLSKVSFTSLTTSSNLVSSTLFFYYYGFSMKEQTINLTNSSFNLAGSPYNLSILNVENEALATVNSYVENIVINGDCTIPVNYNHTLFTVKFGTGVQYYNNLSMNTLPCANSFIHIGDPKPGIVNNITLSNLNTTGFWIFGLDPPSFTSLTFTNISVYNSTNINFITSMLPCQFNMDFTNITYINSSMILSEFFFDFQQADCSPVVTGNIVIENIHMVNSSLGGLIQPSQSYNLNPNIFYVQTIVSNIQLTNNNFTFSNTSSANWWIGSFLGDSVVVTNLTSSKNSFEGGYLFYGMDSAGVFLQNMNFDNCNFSSASLVYNDPQNYAQLLLSGFMLDSSIFSNLWVNSTYPFIQNSYFFNLINSNIFSNITIINTQSLYLSNIGYQFYINTPLLLSPFQNVAPQEFWNILNEVYNENNNNIYCPTDPICFLNYMQGNIFTQIQSVNSSNFYLLALQNIPQISHLISSNTYQDLSNINIYFIQENPAYLNLTADIYTNVSSENYLKFSTNPNVLIISDIIFYQIMANNIININGIFNNNLTYLFNLTFTSNIFIQGFSQFLLSAQLGNSTNLNLYNNLVVLYSLLTSQYTTIGGIFIQDQYSPSSIISFYNNSFNRIIMANQISSTKILMPLQNYFLCFNTPLGLVINLNNNNFTNLQLVAKITLFISLQSSAINFLNSQILNISILNAVNIPIQLSSPNLFIQGITIHNLNSTNMNFFYSTTGLIENVFWNLYSTASFNLTIDSLIMSDSTFGGYLFTLITGTCAANLTNLQISNQNQIFHIQAETGSIFIQNISHLADDGVFLRLVGNGSLSSQVSISNFTLINRKSSLKESSYAFTLNWRIFNFTASNINFQNISFLSINNYVGYLNITNFSINGGQFRKLMVIKSAINAYITIQNLLIDSARLQEILEVSNSNQAFVNIQNIMIYNSNIGKSFRFLQENSTGNNFQISFSSAVLSQVSGEAFISTQTQPNNSQFLQASNVIFTNNTISFVSDIGFNSSFTNILFSQNIPSTPNSIFGSNNNMKNLTNITVYGITSGQASSLFNVTGGSLYVDSLIYGFSTKNILSNYVNTYVNTSLFVFNYNQKHYGTCFNSNNSNISIANSAILYNYGQIGAFAYQSNEISKGTGDIYLENCDLSQNYAYLYGNVSASLPTDANITAAPATRDDEDLGFYFPSFVYVGSSGFMNSSFQVLNLSSSVENYFMFDIVLTDIYNQTLRFDSSTAFNLTAYYPSVDFTTQIEVVFDTLQRVAAFPASALTIPGINTTEVVILNAFYNDLPIQITLNLTTRDCLVGEIYDPATSSCQLCPPEFFSQQVGQSCQNCPAFATCPGGQFIDVLENYWIYPGTTNIYPCLNDGVLRCIGGIDPNNQCSSGYSGALCMGCDFSAGYSQSGANTCSVCADDTLKMMISNGLAFLVSFGIEVLMIYLADKSNKKHLLLLGGKKKELSTEFMIAYDASASTYVFTNLMQLAFLVMIYLSFIETNIIALLDHFQLILYISSSQTQQISNFNCLLINLNYSPEDITYFKVAAGTLLPYVKISVILSFLLFKHYKKPFKDIWGKVWLIVLSILTFDQIGILQSMSNFSTCINGGFQGYSDMDPNISCNSSQFLHFKTTWILPNFVIWALVVPGILIYIFYHFRNNHTNTKVIRIIGGLTTNFSDQGYYWRLVNMLLRLGFLATFTMFTNPKDATVVAFLIMLPYYRLVSKINPYLKEEFQRDEKLSAIVVMISLVCVNQAIDNDDTAVIFYSISIFTMYFLLMGYFALKVFTKFRIQYRLSKEHERTSKISSLDISFSDREEIRDSRTSTISL